MCCAELHAGENLRRSRDPGRATLRSALLMGPSRCGVFLGGTLLLLLAIGFTPLGGVETARAYPPAPDVVARWAAEGRLEELAAIEAAAAAKGVNRLPRQMLFRPGKAADECFR